MFVAAVVASVAAVTSGRQPQAPAPAEQVPAREAAASSGAPPGILITRQLAAARNLRVGQTVRLAVDAAGDRSATFRIDGLYEPVPDPMRFAQSRFEARLHLPDLLALTAGTDDAVASGAVTSINVALKNPEEAEQVARDISQRLPDLVAAPTRGETDRTATFLVLERFHQAIAIVTVLGAATFLLALMVILVNERRATVGVLRLIGLSRRRILLQVLAEGALIAVAGAVFGILFAFAAEHAFNAFFQWRYDTALVFLRITPDVVLTALLISIPLGMLASAAASGALLREELLTLIRR